MRKSLAFLFVGLISGLSLGWWLYSSGPPRWEPPAPAFRQSDGSLILERKSDPQAKATAEVPRGSKLVRVVKVEVQPKATRVQGDNSGAGDGVNPPLICPPAEVDLTFLREPDKTERVVASSPNGTIAGGLDIPVAPVPKMPRIQKWNLSVLRGYDLSHSQAAWGASINYSRGPFVGTTGAIGSTVFVGIGFKF